MKTLIAIINARHRQSWRTAIRSTWLPQVPKEADAFFFMGSGEPRTFERDEVALECSDKYEHLPEKVQSIARWALSHGYDYMLKCDDDVVLRPASLMASGFEKYDFSGKANRPPQPYVVSFGFNYWLSKKSMQIVADATLPEDGSNDDEKWVAKNLWDHNIALVNDNRYRLHTGGEVYPEQVFRRALRQPRHVASVRDPDMVARCIHMEGAKEDEKLMEFRVVFLKYGEK